MIAALTTEEFHAFYRGQVERDFPPEEIPPERMLRAMLDSGEFEGFRYFTQGENEPAGYAILRRCAGRALLFLFAVEPSARGRGAGSAFMRELFEHYRALEFIVLEVERPETAESDAERELRERRIRFYERLGYTLCREVDYSVYYVKMWLMSKPLSRDSAPSAEELAATMREMYGAGLPLETGLLR